MSYQKMMKWNRTHIKGTRQTIIAYTSEKPEFTPSIAFMDKYYKYVETCETEGKTPATMEQYYQAKLNRQQII